MIKGLGIYLGYKYGNRIMASSFTSDHWAASAGWEWNEDKGQFDTPESKRLINNVAADPNSFVMMAARKEKEAALIKETISIDSDNSSKESDTEKNKNKKQKRKQRKKKASAKKKERKKDDSTVVDHLKFKEQELLNKMTNKDEDSVDLNHGGLAKEKSTIRQIDFEDATSTASSLTMNSIITGDTNNSSSSLKSINETNIKKLLNPGMTASEIKHVVDQFYQQQLRKSQIQKETLIASLVADTTDSQPNPNQVTPQKLHPKPNEYLGKSDAEVTS